MTQINEILKVRKSVHGDFTENAGVHQELLNALMCSSGYLNLDPVKVTAIQCICGKLARIVCGDPEHTDHWIDIAGYAQLAADRTVNSKIEKDKENASNSK